MRRSLVPALILVALVSTGCAGSGGAIQPPLALPPLDPRLQSLGQGDIALNVAARSRHEIDPLALARQLGTPPTCADFVFLFSWRTDKSAAVSFVGNRMGGEFDIARGAAGQASVGGCILLEAVNDSATALTGEMRWVVAALGR